ncbi:MoaD/ThiS family protein [Candidatus Sumerlaeota bacterium]|nr:MoaD/ThiS family protein [Candidatus Sumerlaeota bacterium]
MRVHVLYFSTVASAAGVREEKFEFHGQMMVSDVMNEAARRHPGINPYLSSLLVTRNEEWSDRDAIVCDGDTVGLMPPVSGG